MHHLLIGYGYCGYYLAQQLIHQGEQVTALSRHLDASLMVDGLRHIQADLQSYSLQSLIPSGMEKQTLVYYLIPPPSNQSQDPILDQCLNQLANCPPKKLIYFGSSAVYGNHQGNWVNEQSEIIKSGERQQRRLYAEMRCQNFCQQQGIESIILRIAGIYGPHRLPIEAALQNSPLIQIDEAPYTNHIYVKDLVKIAIDLALMDSAKGIYNVADGAPEPMGTLQRIVSEIMNLAPVVYASYKEVYATASPMKREFMTASKRLQINALETILGQQLNLHSLTDGVKQSLEEFM